MAASEPGSLLSLLVGGAGGKPLEVLVRLTASDEVQALRDEVASLQEKLKALQTDYNRLEYNYRCETIVNLRLVDYCRSHGLTVQPTMIWRGSVDG